MPDTLGERVTRCETRLDKVEQDQEATNKIATAVAVIAEKVGNVAEKVEVINTKVDRLERVPGARWNSLVDRLLFALVGGIVAWLLSVILK